MPRPATPNKEINRCQWLSTEELGGALIVNATVRRIVI